MEIRLIRTFIRSLQLRSLPADEERAEHLRFGPVYREDSDNEFVVIFDLKVPLKPGEFLLELQMSAVFQTSVSITEDFKKSHFPRVNAPAVGYPYLRAFVSQFSVLSGFDVYTLPVRNFVKAENAGTRPSDAK